MTKKKKRKRSKPKSQKSLTTLWIYRMANWIIIRMGNKVWNIVQKMVKHLGNRTHMSCSFPLHGLNNKQLNSWYWFGLVKDTLFQSCQFSADSSNTFWTITYSFVGWCSCCCIIYLPPPPPIWLHPFQAFQHIIHIVQWTLKNTKIESM